LQRKGIEHASRLAQEINAAVGDGSKTAILIFQELVEKGHEALQAGAVLRDLIHEMDVSVETAVVAIIGESRSAGSAEIAAAARTAAAGDADVGNMIAEALAKTGPDGIVSLMESSDGRTTVDVREGIYFDRGFLSTRFITDEARQVAELSNALILICDSTLTSMKELLPVLEQVARAKKPLLVIAGNVEGEALETLALNKERGTLSCVAVRAPMVSENRQFMLEDIAIATGGTVISQFSVSLESVRLNQLGRAKHVEVTKDACWITGGAGDPRVVEARAAGIRQQLGVGKGDYDIGRLQERLARLVGSVCAIRVGGASSLDRAERMYQMRSALYSAREAAASGVIPGGGATLFRVGQMLRIDSDAAKMTAAALGIPLRQQIANARQNERDTLARIEASSSSSVGFNAESRKVEDLERAGIVDSTKMCVTAVQLAFVHARAILQTGVWDLTERTAPQSNREP
jgi:chaperonin GroEL